MLGPVNFKDKARPEPLKTKKEENKLEKRQHWGWWAVAISPQGLAWTSCPSGKGRGCGDGSLVGHLWSLHPSGRDFLVRGRPDPECPGKMEAAEEVGKTVPHDRWSYCQLMP